MLNKIMSILNPLKVDTNRLLFETDKHVIILQEKGPKKSQRDRYFVRDIYDVSLSTKDKNTLKFETYRELEQAEVIELLKTL